MRDWRVDSAVPFVFDEDVDVDVVDDGSLGLEVSMSPPWASFHASVRRLMWLSARVNAPAIMVEVVDWRVEGVVWVIRLCRWLETCSSTMRKGRYLFMFVVVVVVLEGGCGCWVGMGMSPSGSGLLLLLLGDFSTGYSHVAWEVWEDTTATSLA